MFPTKKNICFLRLMRKNQMHFCQKQVLFPCLFQYLFLYFFAETVQHGIIRKIYHIIKFLLREIIQIDRIPVRFLNLRTMISFHDLIRVDHPVKLCCIRCTFHLLMIPAAANLKGRSRYLKNN